VLGCEYHAIVRWEERRLESQMGERYRAYAARVSRWLPRFDRQSSGRLSAVPFSWRDTFFSERGTLLAIGVGLVLLWAKLRVG
jgi:hypothetical protein